MFEGPMSLRQLGKEYLNWTLDTSLEYVERQDGLRDLQQDAGDAGHSMGAVRRMARAIKDEQDARDAGDSKGASLARSAIGTLEGRNCGSGACGACPSCEYRNDWGS